MSMVEAAGERHAYRVYHYEVDWACMLYDARGESVFSNDVQSLKPTATRLAYFVVLSQ